MSWLTPILREIQADQAMTRHQRKFFDNGATVNMVIKHDPAANEEKVRRWAEQMNAKHGGVSNALQDAAPVPRCGCHTGRIQPEGHRLQVGARRR